MLKPSIKPPISGWRGPPSSGLSGAGSLSILGWFNGWSKTCRSCCRSLPSLGICAGSYVIERCFVEVRRRTRPMVCFVNIHSVDRIIFSIFNRFNGDWKNHTLRAFTQGA